MSDKIWSDLKYIYNQHEPQRDKYMDYIFRDIQYNLNESFSSFFKSKVDAYSHQNIFSDEICNLLRNKSDKLDVSSLIELINTNLRTFILDKPVMKGDILSLIQYAIDLDTVHDDILGYQTKYLIELTEALKNYVYINMLLHLFEDLRSKIDNENELYIRLCSSYTLFKKLITIMPINRFIDRMPVPALAISTKHFIKLLKTVDFCLINNVMYNILNKLDSHVNSSFYEELFNGQFIDLYYDKFLKERKSLRYSSAIDLYCQNDVFNFASSNKLIMDKLIYVFESEQLINKMSSASKQTRH